MGLKALRRIQLREARFVPKPRQANNSRGQATDADAWGVFIPGVVRAGKRKLSVNEVAPRWLDSMVQKQIAPFRRKPDGDPHGARADRRAASGLP